MLLRLTCLVLALSLSGSSAQVVTSSDERKVHSFVLHEQKLGSLDTAFHIVKSLLLFGEKEIPQRDQACSLAAQAWVRQDAVSLFQATEIGTSLGCISAEDAQAASAAAVEALQPDAPPQVTRAALGILAALKRKGLGGSTASLSSQQLSQVVVGLRKLVHTDGSGRLRHSKGGLPSVEATGLAYLSLAAARELGIDLDDEADAAVEQFLTSPAQVLEKSGTSGSLAGAGDRDMLAAISTFLSGAAAIGTSDVEPAQMKRLLGFLAANKHIGDVQDAYHFAIGLEGYKALVAASPRTGLVVASVTPAILLSGMGILEILVTDFQGKPAQVGGVRLVSAERSGSPALLEQPLQQSPEKAGVWTLDFLSHTTDLGLYKLTVVAVNADQRVIGEMTGDLLVQDELRSGDATLVLSDSDGDELERWTAQPGLPLSDHISLDISQNLKVSFLIKSVKGEQVVQPQHALLRLDNASQGLQAYAIAKPVKKASDGRLHATISHAALEKQIGQQGGTFQLVLMVGDTSGTNAREWTMGSVHISPGQGGSKGKVAPQRPGVLPAHFRPLPEIKHIFQQPSPRPPMLVSYIFTAVVLLPLLGLGYVLTTQLGANLKGFPQEQVARLSAICFHAGVASILGLYTIFWLGLNLLQTLPVLAVLGLFTAASGYQALSRQANARLKAQ
ncbi:hypothetical protein WJX74_006285 [Apatococcus lobatus]|uniref:Ribophorin II n=1 Tax=Apatococcus lobatus TaxID=904363 RepID=A0AAW1RJI3_9CHLO